MMKAQVHNLCIVLIAIAAPWLWGRLVQADFTRNIMLTAYWPPTNDMVRHFSTNSEQNPIGWVGENWENSGYDIYSYFAEFPTGKGKGVGDFEVDYQDTSADFWRVANALHPIAIVAFGLTDPGRSWEVEVGARNRQFWYKDYQTPFQPTPSPPDASAPAGYVRYSTLPMQDIVDAVNAAYDKLQITAFVDETITYVPFLCEYLAYHTAWYHDLHADRNDPYWNVSAGFIHMFSDIDADDGRIATEITLREVIKYVDTQIPEPSVPGDANGDRNVNDLDASILAANWLKTGGATWEQGDFNGDGNVNDLDASILAANWRAGAGAADVPEPATLGLLLSALLTLAIGQRR